MGSNKIGKYVEKEIKVNDLELDKKNPRIGDHDDQPSTITAMLDRKNTFIEDMAESIVDNGFLTLELPCVYPSPTKKGKYIVAEGNRRITALKVLHTPDLAHRSKKHQKFKTLSQAAKGELPSEVKCAVFKNARECLPYVLMRHGLGADGASLRRWDALEKRRADQAATGVPNPALQVIDFVLEHGNLDAKHDVQLPTINISTLERFTRSPSIRSLLGIQTQDCTKSEEGVEWLAPVWQKLVEIVLDEKYQGKAFNSRVGNSVEELEAIVHQVLYEIHKIPIPEPDADAKKDGESDSDGNGSGKDKGDNNGKNSKRDSSKKTTHKTTGQRKGLIEKKFSPAGLAPQKIIDIVDELKKLNASSHANCAGVMFRVFTELSVDHYLKKHRIKKTKTIKGVEVFLSEREKRPLVLKHMKDHKVFSDVRQLKALEDTLDKKHAVSPESLNSYVHSPTQSPHADALKRAWSNLQHIFDVIWDT